MKEMPDIAPLELLDELEAFRRAHQNDVHHPSDWCMRVMEVIVAKAFGFQNRSSWMDALAADSSTKYHRNLLDPRKTGF